MSVLAVLRARTDRPTVSAVQVVRHEVPVLVDGAVAIVVDLVAALYRRHAAGLRNDPGAVRVLAELPGGAGVAAGPAVRAVR